MKRLFLSLVAILVSGIPFAYAAEVAERHIQGFNSTGTVFVFEQYGVQDGSGFPYSEIYQLSTTSSAPIFTPVKRIIQDESRPVGYARRRARRATIFFDGFLDMGTHVFHHALNETPNTVTEARFSEIYATTIGNTGANYKVSVSQQVSPTPACADWTQGNEKTFQVTLENLTSNTTSTLWSSAFPGNFYNYVCPTEYSLADVVLYQRASTKKIAVLVSVLVVGFEGPDRKFVAVIGDLN